VLKNAKIYEVGEQIGKKIVTQVSAAAKK